MDEPPNGALGHDAQQSDFLSTTTKEQVEESSMPALSNDQSSDALVSKPLKTVEPDPLSSVALQATNESLPSPTTFAEHPGTPESRVHQSRSASADTTSVGAPLGNLVLPPKPRTIGGFLVDDDEDVSPATKGLLNPGMASHAGTNALSAPNRSISRSPLANVPFAQSVSSHEAEVLNSSGVASVISNGASAPGAKVLGGSSSVSASEHNPQLTASSTASGVPKARLPHDIVGIFEDRIKADPRGDLEAWLGLINEHRKRNKLPEVRSVYERFLKHFPLAAEQWVAYAEMELSQDNFYNAEQIFNKSLLSVPSVQLWKVYLDYVRRRNNLSTDSTGQARNVISQAYDFVLSKVGIDQDSGHIWNDYLQFVRSAPGTVGGSSWQDQQKMDLLRKAYQRAICVPNQMVTTMWKEYNAFEIGLNKITGRKALQDKSPAYMSAQSSYKALQNITRGLNRTTLPRLPPAPGFDGFDEYMNQVQIWKRWLEWEKEDPLALKDEDIKAFNDRVIYVYKQALMALQFWPEMWYDAASFCIMQGLITEGDDLLIQGIARNPESCLLAFKRADRLEIAPKKDVGDDDNIKRSEIVREPYDKVLDALYSLHAKTKEREMEEVTKFEREARLRETSFERDANGDEDDEDAEDRKGNAEAALQAQIKAITDGFEAQYHLLSHTITAIWIALMRAMRRLQGQGGSGKVGGMRKVFADARKRGKLTSEIYTENAKIEHNCYRDPSVQRIFERGLKLFPADEKIALEYIKHLIAVNDTTNARAVFETTVSRMASKPETLMKAKTLYDFFHDFETSYGDLFNLQSLEKRMKELFPEGSQSSRFSQRFMLDDFNPTAVRIIVSPATQMKLRAPNIQLEQTAPQASPPVRSPKRAFVDDSDDGDRPRKLARGESPLKGAAGRRLDQQKRFQQQNNPQDLTGQWPQQAPPPPSLPRDVYFLLSIIPGASSYHATKFSPEAIVKLLRDTNIPNQPPQIPRPVPTKQTFIGSNLQPGVYNSRHSEARSGHRFCHDPILSFLSGQMI